MKDLRKCIASGTRELQRRFGAVTAGAGGEQGMALVMGLITIMVILLITAGLVVGAMTEIFSAQVAEDSGRALNVAEAGLAHAMALVLREDPNWADGEEADAEDGCGVPSGQEVWKVLKDFQMVLPHKTSTRDPAPCVVDVPYPGIGPFAVSDGGSSSQSGAECASVEISGGAGGMLPENAEIGTYTVFFHPSEQRTPDGNTLRLRVVGKVGRATRGIDAVVRRVTVGDFVAYSASTVDSTTQSGSGTFRVHGSVYIRGDWAFKGNSAQLNDRPVTSADGASPPYENQTYVCGDLRLQGNADIGEPNRPMKAVHIAGEQILQGNAANIFANRIDKAVPDIELPSVPRAVKCIKGMEDDSVAPPINEANCNSEFPGLWAGYTNELNRWIRKSGGSWVAEDVASLLTVADDEFAIPKRGKEGECQGTLAAGGSSIRTILEACAAWYRQSGGQRILYVAGKQVIYLPGRLRLARDVRYRVDDFSALDPDDPDAAMTEGDTSFFVIEGGGATCANENEASLRVEGQLLAWERGSQSPTSFPGRDLLGFVANGCAYISFPGNNAEVDAVLIVGAETGQCGDPNVSGGQPGDLVTRYRLQLYGAVIAKCLKLQDNPPNAYNVEWYQVPDLRQYIGSSLLGGFVNHRRGSAIIILRWREIGF